ncbi:hypothetical protein [Nostoc sp. FACHB-888]|uniref:hypothetical protein n=1 Tax=Nostoc sp. FACHB-888 TaxID=2692842 RepID=UPI001685B016|nr:hypothetical protein [Nostoc sp. FACHB-888]MBD2246781.1 hypothetical protein [Nostoc sp. FACHB-888]
MRLCLPVLRVDPWPPSHIGIDRVVKRAAAAELENAMNVSAHWLRHSHATRALDEGVPCIWFRLLWGIQVWILRVNICTLALIEVLERF